MKILHNIGLLFRIGTIPFIIFLYTITFYEVYVTGYLTQYEHTPEKWEAMSQKYSNMGFNTYLDTLDKAYAEKLDKMAIGEDEEERGEEDRHNMYEGDGDDNDD